MQRSSSLGRALIVVTLMVWSFVAGWAFHNQFGDLPLDNARHASLVAQANGAGVSELATPGDGTSVEPLWTFWEVLSQIRLNYYEPITDDEERLLAYGAAKGMTQALGDPYSEFMEPVVYEEFAQDTQGFLEGIGAELVSEIDAQTLTRKVVVHKPLRGGPAAQAGLLPGDWIVFVNDESVRDKSVVEVALKIRGQRGTPVKITVFREGKDELLDFDIKRERVELPVVDSRMLNDEVGYLLLEQFNDRSRERMVEALSDLKQKGMKKLIFDLRDDTGGTLDAAVEIASLFINEKPVLFVQERDHDPKAMNAIPSLFQGDPPPMVVLINRQTASASEIVAGALRDYGIAKLVGQRSFGKGLVQTVVPLHDPSVRIKLTTAKWLTPNKEFVNRKLAPVLRRPSKEGAAPPETEEDGGLVPDVPVEMPQPVFERRLRDELPDNEDPQLQKAIEVLTQ